MCCDSLKEPAVQGRLIRLSILLTMVGLIAHIVAMSAETWYHLETRPDSSKSSIRITRLIVNIWSMESSCNEKSADGKSTKDIPCSFYVSVDSEYTDKDRGKSLEAGADYTRTMKAFAIMTLLIGLLSFTFSIYCVFHNRYLLKRLAGSMLGMTAMCEIVLLKIFFGWITVGTESIWKPYLPKDNAGKYGYGYFVAWTAFGSFVMAAVFILLASRKQIQRVYYGSTRQANRDEDDQTINLK